MQKWQSQFGKFCIASDQVVSIYKYGTCTSLGHCNLISKGWIWGELIKDLVPYLFCPWWRIPIFPHIQFLAGLSHRLWPFLQSCFACLLSFLLCLWNFSLYSFPVLLLSGFSNPSNISFLTKLLSYLSFCKLFKTVLAADHPVNLL